MLLLQIVSVKLFIQVTNANEEEKNIRAETLVNFFH